MKIDYAGKLWDFSLEEMDVAQCEAVEKYVGKGLGEWANQMSAGGVKAIIALWWVMRAQAGDNPGPVDRPGDDFRPVKLLAAFHAADVPEPEPEPEPRAGPYPAPGVSFVTGARRYDDDTGQRSRNPVPAWVKRVIDGSVIQLRAEYSFTLAHLCAAPPPVVRSMSVLDFARLIDAIDQHKGDPCLSARG